MNFEDVNDGKYRHPYNPYDIQKRFMDAMYHTLSTKKVGVFESPTGTGKTLSLICPALVWLRNRESDIARKGLAEIDNSSGPKWAKESARSSFINRFRERGRVLKELTAEAEKLRLQRLSKPKQERDVKRNRPREDRPKADIHQFCLADVVISRETLAALDQIESDHSMDVLKTPVKIFFASRTHSQLEQLVGSLKLLKIPAAWSDSDFEKVRHVSLGSRKQLCINPEVSKLKTVSQINDRCMELQSSTSGTCEFRKTPGDSPAQNLRDSILDDILDIEDLHKIGSELKCCPYYGSREAIQYSEVVTLPYPLLLQPQARAAFGIDLRGSVVIIDEAHNLIDVISSLNSASLTLEQVRAAQDGLEQYLKAVGSRLSMANRNGVHQVMRIVGSLLQFFESAQFLPVKETLPGTALSISSLLQYRNADVINLFEIQQFLSTSHLAFKVDSYLKARAKQENLHIKSELVLQQLLDFLAFAIDPLNEGKLFFDRTPERELSIRYLLLNPKSEFETVVEQADTIVLAGGTMEPVNDLVQQLFPQVADSDIELFSCGHVIPENHLLADIIGSGPSGLKFEFTFANRLNDQMLTQLGELIVRAQAKIPGGIVVFLPSFAFKEGCLASWRKSGLYTRLSQRVKIGEENKSAPTDQILSEYSKNIREFGHGLLLAVVGGRLSEGINFSDDLARAIIMVGLPFPNAFSAEITARKDHVIRMALERGCTKAESESLARDYYENLSMRAVNQSIGRAIRHIGDYAVILLVDDRYSRPSIRSKLSKWIHEGLERDFTSGNSWGETELKIERFFASKPELT